MKKRKRSRRGDRTACRIQAHPLHDSLERRETYGRNEPDRDIGRIAGVL